MTIKFAMAKVFLLLKLDVVMNQVPRCMNQFSSMFRYAMMSVFFTFLVQGVLRIYLFHVTSKASILFLDSSVIVKIFMALMN